MGDNCDDTPYKHTSFAPLPLPSSLLSKLDTIDITTEEFLPFANADSKNSLADVLLENSCSPFADVRRTGWQELANSSNENAFATALLDARARGQDCIDLAAEELKATATCDVTVDTQRCVLKTLLNVAHTGDVKSCRKICSLKTQILKLVTRTHNPTEMGAIAVQLMECLYRQTDDKDFLSALKVRSQGKCRASDLARGALSSLGSLAVAY